MPLRRWVLFLALLAWAPAGLLAQTSSEGKVVERIVAIVGDSIVLLTQLDEEVERMRVQGTEIPSDPDGLRELRQSILENWIDRLVILQAAAKDTLARVEDDLVEDAVNQEIQSRTRAFGTSAAMQQALSTEGLTLAAYRDLLRTQIREQQVQQKYLALRLQDATPVEVTEEELREAFQEASPQLRQRPRLVSFHQVVVVPEPSDSAKAAARALAESILERVRSGEKFEDLARRYSDDPGSAQLGGDLGWFRRGRMLKEFEDAAFALSPGQVSDVFETEAGYHIVKVERSRPGERMARHILIAPKLDERDTQRARERATEVIAKARAGESMEDLFDQYSDPSVPDTFTVAFNQLDQQLPPSYVALNNASTGDVLGPLEFSTSQSTTQIGIVKVDEIREAGAYTFEEVKGQLAQQLQQQKQISRLLDDLRAKTYIEIRL